MCMSIWKYIVIARLSLRTKDALEPNKLILAQEAWILRAINFGWNKWWILLLGREGRWKSARHLCLCSSCQMEMDSKRRTHNTTWEREENKKKWLWVPLVWLLGTAFAFQNPKANQSPIPAQQLCPKASFLVAKNSQRLRTCFQRLRVEEVHKYYLPTSCKWKILLRSFPISSQQQLWHPLIPDFPSSWPARLHHRDWWSHDSSASAAWPAPAWIYRSPAVPAVPFPCLTSGFGPRCWLGLQSRWPGRPHQWLRRPRRRPPEPGTAPILPSLAAARAPCPVAPSRLLSRCSREGKSASPLVSCLIYTIDGRIHS